MPQVLPEWPDLAQLRRQAKELHRSAQDGKPAAVERLASGSRRIDLNSAQLAVARDHGFSSWPRLKQEVERKRMIQEGDVLGLRHLLAEHPDLARAPISSCHANDGPLGYLGVARFHGLTNHRHAGDIARLLLQAGTAPDGSPDAPESPLVTAASYGEEDIVRALIAAGADLETTGFAVPGGTALAHAVEFGNTEVVDLLVVAGATLHDVIEAAGAGKLEGFLGPTTTMADRAKALRAAAVCVRLETVDRLLDSGVPIEVNPDTGHATATRTVLHDAAYAGKPVSVRHLLDRGADPNSRDDEYNSTPLGWCRHRHMELAMFGEHLTAGHRHVEEILEPLTADS